MDLDLDMDPPWDPAELQRLLLAGTISPARCALATCASTTNLQRCSSCKVVFYCRAEHQAAHRKKHKDDCNKIKKTRAKLAAEEQALRAKPPDLCLPADVFDSSRGHFWGILDTRDYMRARFAAIDALLRVDTCDAVESALAHGLDMLRLCRSDNLGVRDIIPALLLRLGREQDCYDFIKWWATVFANDHYDWGDMTLPYLDIHGADPFEPVAPLLKGHMSLSHASALTLLKVRMYIDVSEYENDEGFPADPSLDRRIGEVVSTRVPRNDHVRIARLSATLKDQFTRLCKGVQDKNPFFWETLINDAEIKPPECYSQGSPEDAALACIHGKKAWEESEDAIRMVEAEVAKYTRLYAPRPVPKSILTMPAHIAEKRRATGTVFPALFRFPLGTPQQLFKPATVSDYAVHRFVSRSDNTQALVFVDGACSNNGQQNPSGGWAVVQSPGLCDAHTGVISARLEEKGPFDVSSVATSNRAELRAAIAALRECNWTDEGFRSLVIATDSTYVVDGATRWCKAWVKNGWKLQTGDTVKNQDLWDLLLGQIEAAHESGLAVEFWKIARELNTVADAAAKAATTLPQSVAEFRDTISPVTVERPKVLALVLESEPQFNDLHAGLINSIAPRTVFARVSDCQTALAELSRTPLSTVILAADGAITRHQAVREKVLDRLHAGATVILAGQFSSLVNDGQFDRLMSNLGLPWKRGNYERSNLRLWRNAVGNAALCEKLPPVYSAKAVFLRNVAPTGAWYTSEHDQGQVAVALARVGQGRLGYVGDVNGEILSNDVVLALCGLL